MRWPVCSSRSPGVICPMYSSCSGFGGSARSMLSTHIAVRPRRGVKSTSARAGVDKAAPAIAVATATCSRALPLPARGWLCFLRFIVAVAPVAVVVLVQLRGSRLIEEAAQFLGLVEQIDCFQHHRLRGRLRTDDEHDLIDDAAEDLRLVG